MTTSSTSAMKTAAGRWLTSVLYLSLMSTAAAAGLSGSVGDLIQLCSPLMKCQEKTYGPRLIGSEFSEACTSRQDPNCLVSLWTWIDMTRVTQQTSLTKERDYTFMQCLMSWAGQDATRLQNSLMDLVSGTGREIEEHYRAGSCGGR